MEPQEHAESLSVCSRVWLAPQVEFGDHSPPAQQLAPQAGARLNLNGQVHQRERALVACPALERAFHMEELQSPLHLRADLEDLLTRTEARPALGGKRGVLH